MKLGGRTALLIGILALLWFGGRALGDRALQAAEWATSQGAAGNVLFIAGYAIATVLLIPGSILTLAAGALFGIAHGSALVFAGAVVGSSLAFLLSRHLVRPLVERRIQGDRRFAAIDQAIGQEGRRIVFLLRLAPVFPFSVLNYGLGLTGVRYLDYLVASVGMLPGTLLYVYYGKLAGDLTTLAAGAPTSRGTGYWIVFALGLAATAAVSILVTRTAKRALASATGIS